MGRKINSKNKYGTTNILCYTPSVSEVIDCNLPDPLVGFVMFCLLFFSCCGGVRARISHNAVARRVAGRETEVVWETDGGFEFTEPFPKVHLSNQLGSFIESKTHVMVSS